MLQILVDLHTLVRPRLPVLDIMADLDCSSVAEHMTCMQKLPGLSSRVGKDSFLKLRRVGLDGYRPVDATHQGDRKRAIPP